MSGRAGQPDSRKDNPMRISKEEKLRLKKESAWFLKKIGRKVFNSMFAGPLHFHPSWEQFLSGSRAAEREIWREMKKGSRSEADTRLYRTYSFLRTCRHSSISYRKELQKRTGRPDPLQSPLLWKERLRLRTRQAVRKAMLDHKFLRVYSGESDIFISETSLIPYAGFSVTSGQRYNRRYYARRTDFKAKVIVHERWLTTVGKEPVMSGRFFLQRNDIGDGFWTGVWLEKDGPDLNQVHCRYGGVARSRRGKLFFGNSLEEAARKAGRDLPENWQSRLSGKFPPSDLPTEQAIFEALVSCLTERSAKIRRAGVYTAPDGSQIQIGPLGVFRTNIQPAVALANGTRLCITAGLLHSTTGPAVIRPDAPDRYYLHGKRTTKKSVKEYLLWKTIESL